MSTWAPHTLFTMGGVLNAAATDKEIWQCGIRLVAVGGSGPLADHDAYLTAVSAPLATWWGLTGSTVGVLPSTAQLSWIKANPIGSDGKYTDSLTHVHDYPTPIAGGGSGSPNLLPDVICAAISWGTRKAIRKGVYASHGRIYLPNYEAITMDGSMRMRQGDNGSWAARGTALLHVLANGTVPAIPVVASGHAGEIEPITTVRVGDVWDVQRRRKDALKESYSSLPFVTG